MRTGSVLRRTGAYLVLLLSAALIGCGPPKPTRQSVFEPLARVVRTHTKDYMVQAPSGCFIQLVSLRADFDFTADDWVALTKLEKAMRELLRQERQMGLIGFTYSQIPVASHTLVPTSCTAAVRAANPLFLKPPFVQRLTVVPWQTVLTEKATEAGIVANASFPYVEQHLVRVAGLIDQDATTTLVDYEWEWAPTPAGTAFNLAVNGRGTGRAVFRKYDDGWRIERTTP